MKILVTGGTGFVGSHCVRALVERGHDLRLLVRNPAKVERVFGPAGKGFELVQGDMTDAALVREALQGCEGALHTAALVTLDRKDAAAVMQANADGVRAVVGGAVEAGCSHVVHVSSVAAIFDPDCPSITADSPVAQGDSPYSRSKAAGDLFARELQAQGAPVHITYPVAVLGPDDPGLSEANNALRVMLKLTSVVTEGAFQMVDVRDLAQGHAAIFEGTQAQGRHLFGGHYMSWRELTDLLSQTVGRRVRRIPMPGWAMRATGQLVDAARYVVPIELPASAEGMVYMTRWAQAQSSPSMNELGVSFRPATESLADTLRSLHAAGHLSAKAIGQLARPPSAPQPQPQP